MGYNKPLLESWREHAISRFGKALVAEMEAHGGPHAYGEIIGVKTPTMGTWVRNTSKPGPEAARRMAEVSPGLVPHLQERGCLDSTGPRNRGAHYQRRQALVPLQASAQTTETAQRQHAKALSEAEQRALKHDRLPRIVAAASRINARAKKIRATRDALDRKYGWFHRNPQTHGGVGAVIDAIGYGAADVAVHERYNTEE